MATDDLAMEWTTRVSLFRNRVVLTQGLIVFGIPILLLGLLMVIITPDFQNRWLVALQTMGIVAGVFAVLLLIVVGVFALAGYYQRFRLDETGVQSELSGRTAVMMKVVRIGLLLSGRPSAMGAGVLMRTGDAIRWRDVRKVTVDKALRQLTLDREGGAPFILACTDDNFTTVCEIVQARAGSLVGSDTNFT